VRFIAVILLRACMWMERRVRIVPRTCMLACLSRICVRKRSGACISCPGTCISSRAVKGFDLFDTFPSVASLNTFYADYFVVHLRSAIVDKNSNTIDSRIDRFSFGICNADNKLAMNFNYRKLV